jgi:hypothetical protein
MSQTIKKPPQPSEILHFINQIAGIEHIQTINSIGKKGKILQEEQRTAEENNFFQPGAHLFNQFIGNLNRLYTYSAEEIRMNYLPIAEALSQINEDKANYLENHCGLIGIQQAVQNSKCLFNHSHQAITMRGNIFSGLMKNADIDIKLYHTLSNELNIYETIAYIYNNCTNEVTITEEEVKKVFIASKVVKDSFEPLGTNADYILVESAQKNEEGQLQISTIRLLVTTSLDGFEQGTPLLISQDFGLIKKDDPYLTDTDPFVVSSHLQIIRLQQLIREGLCRGTLMGHVFFLPQMETLEINKGFFRSNCHWYRLLADGCVYYAPDVTIENAAKCNVFFNKSDVEEFISKAKEDLQFIKNEISPLSLFGQGKARRSKIKEHLPKFYEYVLDHPNFIIKKDNFIEIIKLCADECKLWRTDEILDSTLWDDLSDPKSDISWKNVIKPKLIKLLNKSS